MNVELTLDDKLGHRARHRACGMGLSLSDWIEEVLRKELAAEEPVAEEPGNRRLLNALSMEDEADKPFEIPRDPSGPRKLVWSE